MAFPTGIASALEDGSPRLIGHVTDASELLSLPECQLLDAGKPTLGDDNTSLAFPCVHREGHHCKFEVLAVNVGTEEGDGGGGYNVYVTGTHTHGGVERAPPESSDGGDGEGK